MQPDRFAPYKEPSPLASPLVRRLRDLLGRRRVLSSAVEVEAYAYDASMEQGRPVAVAFPDSAEEVAALYRLCREEGVPLIPRGSGTNLSGGSTAPHGGVVCQMSRMNRILSIDAEARRAVAEAFVYNNAINEAAAPFGLHFAPDPSSFTVSTLGGNAAENSGGPHALKYGVAFQHILGLELVTPDGEIVWYGGAALERPGPDLLSLVVGSEGTLGVITELTLRLTPIPEHVVTLLAIFDDERSAGEAVSAVIASGIIPSTLEFLDRETIRAVERVMPAGYPPDADAVLLIEVDGVREAVVHEAAVVERVCADCGARSVEATSEPVQRDRLWHGRRASYAALARSATGMMVCDAVVPRDVLPQALARIQAVVDRYGIPMADTFHAGDGNVHPKLLFEASDSGALEQIIRASTEIMRACVELGGAITGEHGVGTEKIHAVPWSLDWPTLRLNRAVKLIYDGRELSNPGKVLRPEDVPPEPSPRRAGSGVEADLREASGVATRAGADGDAIDGSVPGLVCTPQSAESLAAVLAVCASHRAHVVVTGGRTALDWGPPPEAPDVLVSTAGLSGVRELRPQNLTATVEAGVTPASLCGMLAEERLTVRFDPPASARATLGGVAATAATGGLRLGFGPLRDSILGIEAGLSTGELASFGGRVMKNVAGYDLTHLLLGSRGLLAAITAVTVRLIPAPREWRLVSAGFATVPEAIRVGERVFRSVREPLALRVQTLGFSPLCIRSEGPHRGDRPQAGGTLSGPRRPQWAEAHCSTQRPHPNPLPEGEGATLSALFAGIPAAVERLASDCTRVMGGDSGVAFLCGQDHAPLPSLDDVEPSPGDIAVELAVPPCRELSAWERLAEHATVLMASIDVGSGRLAAVVEIGGVAKLTGLDADLGNIGGSVLDVHGPAELRRGFFASRPVDPHLRAIKAAFDPAGVLGWKV